MAQKLEEQEENALEIKENFSSLQQEVDIKTKKLKKVKTIKFIVCISCSKMCLNDSKIKNDSPEKKFY